MRKKYNWQTTAIELRKQKQWQQQHQQQQQQQQRQQQQQQSPPKSGCKLHVVFRMLDELPRTEAPILHAFQVSLTIHFVNTMRFHPLIVLKLRKKMEGTSWEFMSFISIYCIYLVLIRLQIFKIKITGRILAKCEDFPTTRAILGRNAPERNKQEG